MSWSIGPRFSHSFGFSCQSVGSSLCSEIFTLWFGFCDRGGLPFCAAPSMGTVCLYVAMRHRNSRVLESEVQSQATHFEFEWEESETKPIGTLAECFALVSILGMLILLAQPSIASSWLLLSHPDFHCLTLSFLLLCHPLFKYLYKIRGKKSRKTITIWQNLFSRLANFTLHSLF